MKSSETPKSPKKSTKKIADETKEVKAKKKSTSTSSTKKTTTKKKVENKSDIVEEAIPVKKETTKKTTTRKSTAKKTETSKVENTKEKPVKEPKKSTTKKVATKKVTAKEVKQDPDSIDINDTSLPPIIISAPNPTPVEKADEKVNIIKPKETVVIHAVTEPSTDNLLDMVHTDKTSADLAFKDVANTCSLIYDGFNVSNNGKIIASFRKCITHTESTDFFNAIAFALHNRFQRYPQEMFNKVIDILDTSPSRFNVII